MPGDQIENIYLSKKRLHCPGEGSFKDGIIQSVRSCRKVHKTKGFQWTALRQLHQDTVFPGRQSLYFFFLNLGCFGESFLQVYYIEPL